MTFLDSFIAQLLATLVGGAIGVFGAWLAFRWQREAASRDGVVPAVETLLQRIAEYVAAADAYRKEWDSMRWEGGRKVQRTYPHHVPVSITAELLRMRTIGDEREVADDIAEAWNAVKDATPEQITSAAGALASSISRWRLGASRERISDGLETARQLALAPGKFEVRPDEDEAAAGPRCTAEKGSGRRSCLNRQTRHRDPGGLPGVLGSAYE